MSSLRTQQVSLPAYFPQPLLKAEVVHPVLNPALGRCFFTLELMHKNVLQFFERACHIVMFDVLYSLLALSLTSSCVTDVVPALSCKIRAIGEWMKEMSKKYSRGPFFLGHPVHLPIFQHASNALYNGIVLVWHDQDLRHSQFFEKSSSLVHFDHFFFQS